MVLLLLLLNAFFVAGEFATVATKKSSIEPFCDSKNFLIRKSANAAFHLMRNATDTLATCQLGVTVCSLFILNVAEPHFHKALARVFFFLDPVSVDIVSFLVSLVCVTYLHVVLGELLPKSAAISYPRFVLLLFAIPLFALNRVLFPAVYLLNAIANFSLRCLRIEPKKALQSAYSVSELYHIVRRSKASGVLEDRSQLLERALLLESVPVEQFAENGAAVHIDTCVDVRVDAGKSAGWVLRYMLREGVECVRVCGSGGEGVVLLGRLESALFFGTGIELDAEGTALSEWTDGKG